MPTTKIENAGGSPHSLGEVGTAYRHQARIVRVHEDMLASGRFLVGAIGSIADHAAEALRRGVTWVIDRTKIHKPPAAA